MSAYKKLNKQDVFVTSYVANKSFTAISKSDAADTNALYNVDKFTVASSSGDYILNPSDNVTLSNGGGTVNQKLGFKSIFQLYYSNYISGSKGLPSGSFENFTQSTIVSSSYRYAHRDLGENAGIITIPQNVYGTHIKPDSFELKISGAQAFDAYSGSYLEGGDSYLPQGEDPTDFISTFLSEEELSRSGSGREYVDDGEGNIMISSSNLLNYSGSIKVGDIIYPHGLAIITDPVLYTLVDEDLEISWKSSQPIYTYNARCKVKDFEMNFTQNPSALSGSDGTLKNNVTGSNFQPYITSVGLYNDAEELLAVAKLSTPVPKSYNTDMTFVIKLDM